MKSQAFLCHFFYTKYKLFVIEMKFNLGAKTQRIKFRKESRQVRNFALGKNFFNFFSFFLAKKT